VKSARLLAVSEYLDRIVVDERLHEREKAMSGRCRGPKT